jgi:hypothetical protein
MKVRTAGKRARSQVHDLSVDYVAVGKIDLRDQVFCTQGLERAFRYDGDTFRVQGACKFRRIAPVIDTGNLRSRKSYDPNFRVLAVEAVEIMEIPAPSTTYDQVPLFQSGSPSTRLAMILACTSLVPP